MAESTASDRIFNLVTANDELIGSLDWVSEETWTRVPAPGEWSAAEIVGHVIELEPHWARMAATIAAEPGSEIGRELTDPARIEGPKAGTTLSPREAKTRLAEAGHTAAEILRKIPAEAWSQTGKWRGGDMTVAELVDTHLVAHVRTHLDQATAALEA